MSSPLSLLDVLATIPDPRHRRGIRHPLPAIFSLAVLAMLTGCKSYQAIAQFGRDKGFALAHVLGFRRGKTPTKATYSILFRRLDVVAFEAALACWPVSKNHRQRRRLCLHGQGQSTVVGHRHPSGLELGRAAATASRCFFPPTESRSSPRQAVRLRR